MCELIRLIARLRYRVPAAHSGKQRRITLKVTMVLVVLLFTSAAWTQNARKKYPWQANNTNCNATFTLCWYGAGEVSDPEVTAWGNRWVTQDKEEKPFEWITEVRCVQKQHLCIFAHNRGFGVGKSRTEIDLYQVQEWSDYQIRAIGENDFPQGHECEIDTLLLNRVDGSVSMLTTPGPAASTKGCTVLMTLKTVMYSLEIGLP
jgi:hypothetical protein